LPHPIALQLCLRRIYSLNRRLEEVRAALHHLCCIAERRSRRGEMQEIK
jgi:hypothetical protein